MNTENNNNEFNNENIGYNRYMQNEDDNKPVKTKKKPVAVQFSVHT